MAMETSLRSSQQHRASPARRVVYCRWPGMLALVAARQRGADGQNVPVAVADGRTVRDVSPAAYSYGIRAGQGVAQARRFCPALLAVSLAEIDYRPALRTLLDLLADVTPVVEPAEPDGAYADLTAAGGGRAGAAFRPSPPFGSLVVGEGRSRLAARACAECGLPPERLGEASVQWLWPEDPSVVARLLRLGLTTFGAVQELPESSLVYQFGKLGRMLHRRAHGDDLTPVKALYPLPRVDVGREFPLEPLEDRERFHAALLYLAADASRQLRQQGTYGRRVRLRVATERGQAEREAILALPVQDGDDLASVAGRLAGQLRLSAAVTGLRLLVEDLEIPAARTTSLFGEREAKNLARLEATRRRLVARFGRNSLMRVGDLAAPPRDARRARVREMRGAA